MSKSNVFYRMPIDRLRQIVAESTSISQVFTQIGLCRSSDQYRPFREAVADLGISIDHFKGRYTLKGGFSAAMPHEEIFVENSPVCPSTVKRALKKDSLIPYCCAKCNGDPIWQEEVLSLQLDHINGINTDNRLTNLRWLCPNCHSQTPTYAGKRTEARKTVNEKGIAVYRHSCPKCGNESSAKGVQCRKCYTDSTRISDWPSREELEKRVWDMPLWQVAHSLGHSRNDVAEHCRYLGICFPPKGYWQKRAWGRSHEEALATKPIKPIHKITPEIAEEMRQLHREGLSARQIGTRFGFHHTNVARVCRNGALPETCTLPPTLEM